MTKQTNRHTILEIYRSGSGGDPNIDAGSLKRATSFNVYPSTITAVASTGTALGPTHYKNYEFFNVAQTSASSDFILLPSAPIGTVMHFQAVSAFSIKAGADSSGLTINGAADTAVLAVPAAGVARLQKATSTNWIASVVTSAGALVSQAFSGSATGDGITQFAEVSITNAEMLAIRATPKTLVAAPGAGKVLEFVSAQLFFDYTAAYTESTDNLAVKFENGSGAAVSQTIEATGFVDATADTITNALAKIDAIVAKTGSENKALVLHNTGDGEYGGGNAANAIRVKVAYRVWTTGF